MTRDAFDKVTCRTLNAAGTTNIPRWKYDLLHAAIIDAIGDKGLAFKDLKSAVAERLSDDDRNELGSLGWHLTTVKLEMEVAGDIHRVPDRSPQWLMKGRG